jgi:hypothetical protein
MARRHIVSTAARLKLIDEHCRRAAKMLADARGAGAGDQAAWFYRQARRELDFVARGLRRILPHDSGATESSRGRA